MYMRNNLRKLGIIQPGRIGDIIICLPIAKYYFDKGYEIIWPIDKKYINHFVNHINYVRFIESPYHIQSCYNICLQSGCNNIIDLSFRLPGPVNNFNNTNFELGTLHFDELKYEIANVPLEEKYNLSITRNKDKENQLVEELKINNEKYSVIHTQGSDGYRASFDRDIFKNNLVIEISEMTESVFDWIKVLEGSESLCMIDSCFSNLCNQLKLKQKKYFVHRPPPNVPPAITSDWVIHNE